MIGYNPSHLNRNETLLEAFHRVEAYLKANPQYQVYQSSATYQEGTQEYALDTIVVPEGSTVGKGDVVLFSNVYYAVITSVSETTFSVETATNFRGAQGEQGPNGNTGATGEKGETGLPALMYSKNVILGPSTSFSTDLDGYNRTPQINDVCLYISSNTDIIVSGIVEEIRPDTQQVMVRKETFITTQGPQGPAGPKGENGKDGNATLLYSGELSESITTVEIAQITRPKNRGILVKDILISTAASTFGAMAQVTEIPTFGTTVTVSFIGTPQGGSGVSDYNELANIPVINQDLSATDFTPVANTYYRHTFTVDAKPSVAQATQIVKIINNAKRILNIEISVQQDGIQQFMSQCISSNQWQGRSINAYSNIYIVYNALIRPDLGSSGISVDKTEFKNGAFLTNNKAMGGVTITYLNDTEIT